MQTASRRQFATTFRPGRSIDLDGGELSTIQLSLRQHGFSDRAIGGWTTGYLETAPEILRANLDGRHN